MKQQPTKPAAQEHSRSLQAYKERLVRGPGKKLILAKAPKPVASRAVAEESKSAVEESKEILPLGARDSLGARDALVSQEPIVSQDALLPASSS